MGESYRNRSNSRGYGNQRNNDGNGNFSNGDGGGKRRGNIGILIVILVVLVGIGAGVAYLFRGSGPANAAPSNDPGASDKALLSSDKFYDGVSVDGIPLGGLTRDEAKGQIEEKQKQYVKEAGVTVVYDDNNKWPLPISDLPEGACGFDTEAVLDEAYRQGRDQTTEAERLAYIEQLPQNPVSLTTKAIVSDLSSFEQRVRDLTTSYYVAPVDAAYAGFDAKKPAGIERLTFNPDVPGHQVNPDTLWAAVKSAFESGTFGTVQMVVEPVPAAVTLDILKADLQLIGQYETEIRNDKEVRRKNIEIAHNTVSGRFLLPGEMLSLNESTGERTAAKGYGKAPVDSNGIEDIGLAGGVCQVSGTLYNAAIAAGPHNIEIVERRYHSIPSSYMGKGLDATVDYPDKDLKIKNVGSKPLLIIMYTSYDKSRKVDYHEHCEIYGPADPEGATYCLEPHIVKTVSALSGTRVVNSNAMKPGETRTFNAHPGYYVDVYLKKTAKDGTVTKTKLYQDFYKPDMKVIAKYKDDPAPTESPSPAPSALTPTQPPTQPPTEPPTDPPTDPPTSPPAG